MLTLSAKIPKWTEDLKKKEEGIGTQSFGFMDFGTNAYDDHLGTNLLDRDALLMEGGYLLVLVMMVMMCCVIGTIAGYLGTYIHEKTRKFNGNARERKGEQSEDTPPDGT